MGDQLNMHWNETFQTQQSPQARAKSLLNECLRKILQQIQAIT